MEVNGWTTDWRRGIYYHALFQTGLASSRHCLACSEATATSHNDCLLAQPLPGIAGDILLAFRAESAHEIDDEGDQQNQANTTAADERTAKVKPATAEQEKKNK